MGTSNNKTKVVRPESAMKELEKKTKNLDSQFLNDELGSGSGQWDAETKALMDNFTLKSLFFTEDWVFILLDLMASEISDVDMKVAKETFTRDGRNVVQWLDDHPLNKIIQKPNPQQDYSTWMYLHVVEYCLMGNAIQWFAENLNQLHIIPAEQIFLDVDPSSNELSRYVVHSQFGSHNKVEAMIFPPDQILHQRRPNPVSVLWGLSPFVPNAKALLFNRYTQDYLNAFYLKQATGQLALSLDKQVSEEAAMRLMRSFEHSYTGRRNARRTMLLPKGVTVDTISSTIADQNLIEVVNQNREKIMNILRIPKHALSLAENGSLGSEEFKISLKFMWTSSIKPTMKKIAATFTDYFQGKGMLAEDEKFMFDLSHIEILREDSIRTADLAIKHLEFKTLNEVRKDLFDLPPLEGGDETPNPMVDETIEVAEGGSTGGGGGGAGGEPIPAEPDDKHMGDLNIKTLMTRFGNWFDLNQKQINENVEKTGADLETHMLAVFTDMARNSVKNFRSVFKDKKSYGPQKLKAAEGSRARFKDRLNESFNELEEGYVDGYQDSLEPALDVGYKANLDSIFNDNVRERVEELGQRDAGKRQAQLRARGLDSFGSISDTTVDQVLKIVDQGVEDGSTVDAISTAIVAAFAAFGQKRAEKIASTESFTAVSLGKKAALDNATEIVPNMIKVWVNTGDEKVRGNPAGVYPKSKANHWRLQGEMRAAKSSDGKDTTFSNGLIYPRDVTSAKAEEVIRCRCDMLMVAPADLDSLSIARP